MAQLKSLSINGNDVVDYVIAQGSLKTADIQGSSNGCTWNYTKWASGKYELWCYENIENVSVNTGAGSLFTSANILPPTLPTDMLNDSEQNIFPVINKTLQAANWGNLFIMNATSAGAFKIACPTSVDSCVVVMNYYVIGRWK